MPENEIQTTDAPMVLAPEIAEQLMINGDLSNLTVPQRVQYYGVICERSGLDPSTRPFEYIKLNGKLTLYARKACTQQLRRIHSVSVTHLDKELTDTLCTITVTIQNANGRTDTGVGVVWIENLKGELLANAIMKAETKAKRRATLSICGLGMMDEAEIPRDRKPVTCTVKNGSKAKAMLESKMPEKQAKSAFKAAVERIVGKELPKPTLKYLFDQAKKLAGTEDIHKVTEWLTGKGTIIPEYDESGNEFFTVAPPI